MPHQKRLNRGNHTSRTVAGRDDDRGLRDDHGA
jgi:hypothetical protein